MRTICWPFDHPEESVWKMFEWHTSNVEGENTKTCAAYCDPSY